MLDGKTKLTLGFYSMLRVLTGFQMLQSAMELFVYFNIHRVFKVVKNECQCTQIFYRNVHAKLDPFYANMQFRSCTPYT